MGESPSTHCTRVYFRLHASVSHLHSRCMSSNLCTLRRPSTLNTSASTLESTWTRVRDLVARLAFDGISPDVHLRFPAGTIISMATHTSRQHRATWSQFSHSVLISSRLATCLEAGTLIWSRRLRQGTVCGWCLPPCPLITSVGLAFDFHCVVTRVHVD